MERLEKRLLLFAVIITTMVLVASSALAQPIGTGTLTQVASSRGTDTNFSSVTAQGGNVTNIDLDSSSITSKWAGFYGDVTGSITLETGGGAIFYNWSDASPAGEVFASRDASPTWGSIACGDGTTISTESSALSLSSGMDNITNTFCTTCGNHSAFDVGGTAFTADQCDYRTNVFNGTGSQTTNWDQVLLTDGADAIYTTIMNQDTNGFDGSNYDFQLLLAENSTAALTTYYFFVEIT